MNGFGSTRSLLAVFLLLALPSIAPAADPMRAAAATAQADFLVWLADFRSRAIAGGISAATVDRAFDGLTFNPRVVALDRAQPDDSRPATVPKLGPYLAARLTALRIDPGTRLLAEMAPVLRTVEARYGVPPQIVLGIWGMETSYGAVTGDFDTIRSLATLAFDGRREALFSRELMAALKLLDRGDVRRDRLIGSWAGAMGNTQFLPTSYLKHAVDFDADGRADIWSDRADTAASIAKYLQDKGWHAGGDWAMRVYVPPGLERERVRNLVPAEDCTRVLAKHSRWIPVAEWKSLGLRPLDGRAWPSDDTLATLLEPDGPGQGGYLTYGNYRALLGYNCSNFYALSVGLLADAIRPPAAGADPVAGGVRGQRP